MSVYWQNLSIMHKMYGNDSYTGNCMTSCPICYCAVEEKFMAMHILWHEEVDPKEQGYPTEHVPISRVEYEL